jgi:hypothetical protein
MAGDYAVYISTSTVPSNARIRQAVEGTKVGFFAEDEGRTEHPNWVRFEIRWPEGLAVAHRLDVRRPDFAEELTKRAETLRGPEGESDERVARLRDRLRSAHTLFTLTAPDDAEQKLAQFASFLAAETGGLLLRAGELRDAKGRLCLGTDGTFDPDAGWDIHPSATARKARTEDRLRAAGVPVDESLPPIDADEEAVIRPPWEVARRAEALVTVAARSEGLDPQRALQFLQAWGLWEAASPKEQAYLTNPHPTEQERVHFLWQYECLWVMLWALGVVESLGLPNTICDVRRAVRIATGTTADVFIGQSNLRPATEILDEADLAYRCNAAVNVALDRSEPPPAGLDIGVTHNRLIALNWLRCQYGLPWDEVTAA